MNNNHFPILSLYPHIKSYDYDYFISETKKQRHRNPSLKLDNFESIKLDFDTFLTMPPLFYFEINNWRYDFFYNDCQYSDKIYIIFSGSRYPNKIPLFKRNSWNYFFDGAVLYVADPMFYKFDKLQLGWYLGTNDDDIFLYILRIICKVIAISKKKVVVAYGSSGGGYAAIKFGQFFDCISIAINPQIFLHNYQQYDHFFKITKITIDSDFNARMKLVINLNSKYLILFNETDKSDITKQLFPFLKNFYSYPKYGLSKVRDNIYVYIYHAIGGHNSQEDLNFLQFIIFLYNSLFLEKMTEERFKTLDALSISLSNIWADLFWSRFLLTHNNSK